MVVICWRDMRSDSDDHVWQLGGKLVFVYTLDDYIRWRGLVYYIN